MITAEFHTLRDWLRHAVSRFQAAQLYYGHGCDNAFDEAVWLITHHLHLPAEHLEVFLDARLTQKEGSSLQALLKRRVEERMPAAYLTGQAWLGDYSFHVDQRVIIPRSYFARLLEDGLSPWISEPENLQSALDLCTGSGCLAILMAQAFPEAEIDAVDLSPDALAVARRNIADYALEERVHPLASDLFQALNGRRYDLILSNPPYVTQAAMAALPAEYRHEPQMALAAGEDGLDIVRRILAGARQHLHPGGWLAVEVGHNRDLVEAAYPELPLTWISDETAEDKIFIIQAEDIPACIPDRDSRTDEP